MLTKTTRSAAPSAPDAPRRRLRHAPIALALAAAAIAGSPGSAAAAPAAVPCSSAGSGAGGAHYNCGFYPAGGAPVQAADGRTVGTLHKGTNWVICQRTGVQARSGAYYNNNWAWTLSDQNTWGWVNAVYAQGGDNNGAFGGVPACGGAQGNAPGGAPGGTPPPPPPPPASGSAVGGAISRGEVLARSLPWIQRGVMYSQSRYTDGYRQDCSGYISLVWHLNGSPNSTSLRSSRYTRTIGRGELQPGDMLGHPGHVALFVGWASGGRAIVREEWDYGHPASERTWSASYTRQNTAYRYHNIR